MVRWPESISSAKPLSTPSFIDRTLNSGLIFLLLYRVNIIETGTVTAKTATSVGEIEIIMTSEPVTVIMLTQTCIRSCESEAFTVSTSYEMWLIISPVAWVSK